MYDEYGVRIYTSRSEIPDPCVTVHTMEERMIERKSHPIDGGRDQGSTPIRRRMVARRR